MIYTVRLTYCFRVEAQNQREAYYKAKRLIKEEPAGVIADIVPGYSPRRSKPLWKALVFGP